MVAKAIAATRAPRGTKILTQAFFGAADEIAEPQRNTVVKAALAAIRDQLKANRQKAKVVKAKTKAPASKASPVRRAQVAAPGPKKQRAVAAKGKRARVTPGPKAPAKAGRKASAKPSPEAASEDA